MIINSGGSRTRRRLSFFFFLADLERFAYSTRGLGAAVLRGVEGCIIAGWAATITYVRWSSLLLPGYVRPALSRVSLSRSTLLSWWAIFLPYVFAGPSRLVTALSMAAAITSKARAAVRRSLAFCWANVWIFISSLPLGVCVLEASGAGGGDPSRRFFDGGEEPADEDYALSGRD